MLLKKYVSLLACLFVCLFVAGLLVLHPMVLFATIYIYIYSLLNIVVENVLNK